MRGMTAVTLAALAACSTSMPTETPAPPSGGSSAAPVSLHNAMAQPLAYVAAGEGTLALLVISPTLAPGTYDDRRVSPGATAMVTDIIGYQRDLGVTFHLYRVNPATCVATFARSILVSAAELARNGGVVTVDPSRL